MNRSLIVTLLILLAGLASAQDSQPNPVGRKLSVMFQTAGAEIIAPKPPPKPDPVTDPLDPEGGRSLTVWAYSYCLRGVTASGRYTRHGIIAVDPRVIPLGSRLYVPGYGWGIAADTGGAIIGNKIDLWRPTAQECYDWGVRRVTIKVFPRR